MDYVKMEADTWLRINVDLIIREYVAETKTEMCASWYIKVGVYYLEWFAALFTCMQIYTHNLYQSDVKTNAYRNISYTTSALMFFIECSTWYKTLRFAITLGACYS